MAGRFVSRDPLGLWGDPAQRGNGQGYCGANPVNRVDPMGLRDAPGVNPYDRVPEQPHPPIVGIAPPPADFDYHYADPYHSSRNDPVGTAYLRGRPQPAPIIEARNKSLDLAFRPEVREQLTALAQSSTYWDPDLKKRIPNEHAGVIYQMPDGTIGLKVKTTYNRGFDEDKVILPLVNSVTESGGQVLATFHTHPTEGEHYTVDGPFNQEGSSLLGPSPQDKQAFADNPGTLSSTHFVVQIPDWSSTPTIFTFNRVLADDKPWLDGFSFALDPETKKKSQGLAVCASSDF